MENKKKIDFKFFTALGVSLVAIGLSIASLVKGAIPGPQGNKGADGNDGVTPTISINQDGYWVINGTTTSVLANGQNGGNGNDGKSAYDIAVENGYTGTELDFANDLLSNNMSYGTMRNIALNAMHDYGLSLFGDFNSQEDALEVIDTFEPFTINIDSSFTADPLDGSDPDVEDKNTATITFDFNEDNDIVGHMLFIDTDSEGAQHKDEVYLAVIKDGNQNKHYYVTLECMYSYEPNVWEEPDIQAYQELDELYYKLLTASLVAKSRFTSELYSIGNIFMPTDMLGFMLSNDTDGTQLNQLLVMAALSDCFIENDIYKFTTVLPGSDQNIYQNLSFTLFENGRIESGHACQKNDYFDHIETMDIAFNVTEAKDFDELNSIPKDFYSYYDSGEPNPEPIVLNSEAASGLSNLSNIINCIASDIEEALMPTSSN